ncbi:MAG: fimbrillin family protein [Prevotellaceae bacterium]|nr:fimbrillin family protein [Candidatus Minthosoma equi]
MKITHNILALFAGLGILTACSDDLTAPTYTVGEADNAIVLRAGISEGNGGLVTRAGAAGGYDDIDEANHNKHLPFSSGTKATLRIDGDWWKTADATSGDVISKSTTATIGVETVADSKHNSVTMSPQLYWDDYGTADPNNMSDGRGRKKGLTIYGVAVNDETTAPEVSTWEALSWTLAADQSNNWNTKDLLISNNVKVGGPDDTYKFEERSLGKLLEFTHAMSKITVRLIANDGFPTTGTGLVGNTTNKFEALPEVKLTSNETGGSNTEWAYTSCNVNVTTGAVTSAANPAVITMYSQTTSDNTYTAIYDALVVPGSCFGTDDNAVIARIEADGNIYYVTAKEIRAKSASTDYKTASGKNYIITVKVNKTDIDVTATIKNWEDVEAGEASPKINVTADWGDASATGTITEFCLYRSASDVKSDPKVKNDMSGYSKGLNTAANNGFFPHESVITKSSGTWTMSPALYWPAHDTHYHFRGVMPTTSTAAIADGTKPTAPHVEALSASDATQIIKIWDAEFGADLFPSNLAIGKPIIPAGTKCSNGDHPAVDVNDYGICATEGKINLEFKYMMSQVEVELKTTDGDDKVRLEDATVEIINGYIEGYAKLGDREIVPTGSVDAFTLPAVSTAGLSGDALTTAENTRKGAIVPQKLYSTTSYTATPSNDFTSTNNLRFKITITNTDGTHDVYYTDIAPIKKKGTTTGEMVAPDGYWKSGTHYKYELTLSKTGLTVIATLKDWIHVEAVEDIWF